MFKMVSHVMHKNKIIWIGNQIIVDCVKQLDDTIKSIENANLKLGKTTKIITVGKTSLRKSITDLAFQIKESMRLYYFIIKNIEEMQLLIYPISKLNLMNDNDFYQKATNISDKSLLLVNELIPYRITIEMINKLKDDLLEFKTCKPERDLLSQTNANLIKQIPLSIEECRLMLRNMMNSLVDSYKATNNGFIIAYHNSRILHKRTGSHKHYSITIRGKVTQFNKTNPFAEVIVCVGKKKKTTITDINGNYTIIIYTKDADNITFTYPGFATQIHPIKLVNPEKHKKATYTINAVMVKDIINQD